MHLGREPLQVGDPLERLVEALVSQLRWREQSGPFTFDERLDGSRLSKVADVHR